MLQTPDGGGRIELFEYIHPEAIKRAPTPPHEIGVHRVAFSVDDIDEALRISELTYVRGPCGIIVIFVPFVEELEG